MKPSAQSILRFTLPLMAILGGCGDGNTGGQENGSADDASSRHNMQVFVTLKNPTWTSIEAGLWISRGREDPSPQKTGLVWSREGDPSRENALGNFSGESSSLNTLIEDLVPGETYRIAAYAEFDFGVLHSAVEEFTMPEGPAIGVGETYQEGIIAYFFREDDPQYVEGEVRGLLAAPRDAGDSQWGGRCGRIGELTPGLGLGRANTRKILAFHEALDTFFENPGQCHEENDGTVAAKLAAEFQHGGHQDWFLPSEDELRLLYRNLQGHGIGDFSPVRYWSSSEVPAGHRSSESFAANVDFSDGGRWTSGKEQTKRVRPVRYFQ